jgi:aryl-alcohol dehydrogenase-like predicted oxidoreductase
LRDNLGALDVSLSDEIKAQVQAIHQRIPNPAP